MPSRDDLGRVHKKLRIHKSPGSGAFIAPAPPLAELPNHKHPGHKPPARWRRWQCFQRLSPQPEPDPDLDPDSAPTPSCRDAQSDAVIVFDSVSVCVCVGVCVCVRTKWWQQNVPQLPLRPHLTKPMMIPMTIFYSWQVATAQPGAGFVPPWLRCLHAFAALPCPGPPPTLVRRANLSAQIQLTIRHCHRHLPGQRQTATTQEEEEEEEDEDEYDGEQPTPSIYAPRQASPAGSGCLSVSMSMSVSLSVSQSVPSCPDCPRTVCASSPAVSSVSKFSHVTSQTRPDQTPVRQWARDGKGGSLNG